MPLSGERQANADKAHGRMGPMGLCPSTRCCGEEVKGDMGPDHTYLNRIRHGVIDPGASGQKSHGCMGHGAS